jgi:ferritin
MTDLTNITLEHLRAIRGDVSELRNDSRDIKAGLAVLRAYIADQHTEQNLLNTRLAAAEMKIERIEHRLALRDE